jgi:hypothetical protein
VKDPCLLEVYVPLDERAKVSGQLKALGLVVGPVHDAPNYLDLLTKMQRLTHAEVAKIMRAVGIKELTVLETDAERRKLVGIRIERMTQVAAAGVMTT